MFQFRRFPAHGYLIHRTLTGSSPAGLPHSDIHGSKPICGSPWLFAACHVLHRLLMPRHPPCALLRLTASSRKWRWLGARHPPWACALRLTRSLRSSFTSRTRFAGLRSVFEKGVASQRLNQLQSSCTRIMQAPLTEVLKLQIFSPFY